MSRLDFAQDETIGQPAPRQVSETSRPVIRKATLEDGPRVVEMAARFIQTTVFGRILKVHPKALEEMVPQVLQAGVLLVAEVDGRLVGMIAAIAVREPMSRQAMADEIVWWVEPEHRASSIGPRLLAQLEVWIRQKQLSWCKMVAPVGSGVGEYLERAGYAPLETAYYKRLS